MSLLPAITVCLWVGGDNLVTEMWRVTPQEDHKPVKTKDSPGPETLLRVLGYRSCGLYL